MKEFTTTEVAKITGLSIRRIQQACEAYELGSWFSNRRKLTEKDIKIILKHKR